MTMLATIHVRTVSEANLRTHWAVRHRRARDQRKCAWASMRRFGQAPEPPLVVTMTRLGGRKLDDDNLRGALKAVRDGIADWLGIDDGSDLVTWAYGQEPGGRSATGVRVEVKAR